MILRKNGDASVFGHERILSGQTGHHVVRRIILRRALFYALFFVQINSRHASVCKLTWIFWKGAFILRSRHEKRVKCKNDEGKSWNVALNKNGQDCGPSSSCQKLRRISQWPVNYLRLRLSLYAYNFCADIFAATVKLEYLVVNKTFR